MTTSPSPRWAFAITVELTDEELGLLRLSDDEWDALCESDEPVIGIGHYIEALGDDADNMLPALDLIKDGSETQATIYLNADRDTALAQLTAAVAHYGLRPFTVERDGDAR